MHADGSAVRPLRRGISLTGAFDLAWSPNGRQLAFVAGNALWRLNADGNGLTRVLAPGEAPGFLASPSWTPDGSRIAMTAGGARYHRDIWVVDADGGNLHRLAGTHGSNETRIDWNPRGGSIAFSGTGFITPIAVIDTRGGNLRQWWGEGYGELWLMPDWAPDGGRVAFSDAGDLAVIDTREGELERRTRASFVQLTKTPAVDSEPDWSPDGRQIVFVRADGRATADLQPPGAPRSSSEIYAIKPDGTGLTRLTHNRIADTSPAWQPPVAS